MRVFPSLQILSGRPQVLADHFKRELASVLAEKMAGIHVSAHVSAAVQPCVDGISGRIPPAISFIVGILTGEESLALEHLSNVVSTLDMSRIEFVTFGGHFRSKLDLI